LGQAEPQKIEELRKHLDADRAEVCGGCYVEREDQLLPVDSQLWNLLHGQEVSRKLLGRDIQVFARKRFGLHPQLPLFFSSRGIQRAPAITLDDSSNAGPP